jgi:hypothetical protein
MTTPMAQTDNDNKHDPAIPNASTKKPSRREDDEVRTVPKQDEHGTTMADAVHGEHSNREQHTTMGL